MCPEDGSTIPFYHYHGNENQLIANKQANGNYADHEQIKIEHVADVLRHNSSCK